MRLPIRPLMKYLKMNKEDVLIITFYSMQDAFELENKSKEGRIIPVPSCVKSGCGMCFMSKDLDEEKWRNFLQSNQISYESIVKVKF